MSDKEKKTSKKSREEMPEEKTCSQCEEATAGWKRALADYDNLKKDLAQEKEEMRASIKLAFTLELLPVLENLQEATTHRPKDLDKNVENWVQGILHINKQLEDVVENKLGIVSFGKAGDVFDPNLHEAIGEKTDTTRPDQIVLQVVKKGWKQKNGYVSVPAKVIVNNIEA